MSAPTATPALASPVAARRRGACPSLAAPMETGDGLIARLAPAGGRLTPAMLAGLAAAADRFGNGTVEITARASLQVRGLTEASAGAFAAAVADLAVPLAEGVPTLASPLAGEDDTADADPRRLLARLAAAIDAAGLAARLGPKVSIVVEAGGRVRLDAAAADVRLAAEGGRWRLGLAGDRAAATWFQALDEEAAAVATVAVLGRIAAAGRAARARDLLSAPPSLPAALGDPIAGAPPRANDGRSAGAAWLGAFALAGGSAFGAALPFGHIAAADLAAYAAAAVTAEAILLAPRHGLIATGLDAAATARLAAACRALDLAADAADPRLDFSACPGAPGCASGYLPARALAAAVAEAARPLLDAGGTVHLSGCAKGCAHPAAAALTLVGGAAGVGLVHHGPASAAPAETVGPDGLLAAVRRHAAELAAEMTAGDRRS